MTMQIDRRDAFSYAEGRRLAERERAIVIRLIWKRLAGYVRCRVFTAPGAASGSQPLLRAVRPLLRAG